MRTQAQENHVPKGQNSAHACSQRVEDFVLRRTARRKDQRHEDFREATQRRRSSVRSMHPTDALAHLRRKRRERSSSSGRPGKRWRPTLEECLVQGKEKCAALGIDAAANRKKSTRLQNP